mgnify:FL=1
MIREVPTGKVKGNVITGLLLPEEIIKKIEVCVHFRKTFISSKYEVGSWLIKIGLKLFRQVSLTSEA